MANPFANWSIAQAEAHNARINKMKVRLNTPVVQVVTPDRKAKAPSKKQEQSPMERRFDIIWSEMAGPPLETEIKFHPVRKWRFDRGLSNIKLAIELEGGVFSGGRHTRGAGYAKDCEKYNTAQMCGWIVLRLPVCDPKKIREILEFVKQKLSQS